ncbi:hypothetical protein GCM10010967_11860 [Dyadobacter beijingensis]|uniref:Uncharacterized protein n=1 Tax=Dyadobacter beijingensis TaxID=365489 RepID=A0ABQ2HIY5_9BACT|nr:hypothetical protein [Dyadobacter beijingensis]GGM81732.1 hypothetical protein GCM10010967_11860 [Dyadobacter beijingensis]
MLSFKSEDKTLLIWINGNTKLPESLTQEELAQLKENGDQRVIDQPETPVKGKQAAAQA